MPASNGKCNKAHGQKGRDSPGEPERDWEITVHCAANISVPVLFLLFIVPCCVLVVINVWLFVESHPECWHRETPRSTSSAHRVTPQLLMHTSRWTHHRITQVVIWLADCPPPPSEVTGRHRLSAIHNCAERRCIVSRSFCSDRDVCWHLFGGRQGVTESRTHTPTCKAKVWWGWWWEKHST